MHYRAGKIITYLNTLAPESRVFKLVEGAICFFNNIIELNGMAVFLSLWIYKEAFQNYVGDLNLIIVQHL